MFRRLLSLFAALMLLVIGTLPANASAYGTVQVTNNTEAGYRTCSAFTAPATSTSDFAELYGSASKTLYVKRVLVAMSYTASGTTNPQCFLLRRSTANTSGTATTETVIKLDTNAASGTGVAKTYTVNPTTGTLVGRLAATTLGVVYNPGTGAGAGYHVLYESKPESPPLVLRGTSEGIVVNFNGTKPDGTTPLVSVVFEWSEK